MPYTTHYVDDGKGVHKTGTGVVTGAEIFISAMQRSSDEDRARKVRYGLIDLSAAKEIKVTPTDIQRIVEMNRKTASYNPGSLVAVIAPGQMAYAMARMWHALVYDLGWTTNVFHTRADAVAWLKKELRGSCSNLSEFSSLAE